MASIYNDEKWIGQKFNRLTVVEPVSYWNGHSTQWYWRVRCDCGNERVLSPYSVIHEKVLSCGCYYASTWKNVNLRHGMSHTHLHNIWCGIHSRCHPEHGSHKYGKRGIKVCEEWSVFENFRDWALQNGYEEGLSIERKDVNGDYCPENCTWIPLSLQGRNKRDTRWVEYQGRTMSLAEAVEIAGAPYKQVHARLQKGWSLEQALTVPYYSNENSLRKKCTEKGVRYKTVWSRIHVLGWDEEKALNTPMLENPPRARK